jgi:Holliday junction resolvase
MPNRARNRGDYLERQTKAAFEEIGYWVIRAAGSFGVADLVALRADKRPVLISCKITGTMAPAERAAIRAASVLAGGRPVLATRDRPGWVTLYAVTEAPRGPRVDEIKAPPHAAR